MSLQLSTGAGSLVALGLSISDASTIVSLGRRFGNWWTTKTDDVDFLDFLGTDEFTIMTCGGLLDLLAFNKRWGESLHILANGKPQRFELSPDAGNELLGRLSKFTASMLCTVAVLDEFTDFDCLTLTMKLFFEKLLRAHEYGEDLIASQLSVRINGWRSAAVARGITSYCRERRISMIKGGVIQNGSFRHEECLEVAEFFYWLFATKDEVYSTNSSDVVGIALCLTYLGFDTLSIEGYSHARNFESASRLIYSQDPIQRKKLEAKYIKRAGGFRYSSTILSLTHPEECVSNFPLDAETATRCRNAWKSGSRAAQSISIEPISAPHDPIDEYLDLEYRVVDRGEPMQRLDNDDVYAIVERYALAINQDVCTQYASQMRKFHREDIASLVDHEVRENCHPRIGGAHSFRAFGCRVSETNIYCVHQAFFMGYYYTVLLQLVDTDGLDVPMVDGLWGFKNCDGLLAVSTLADSINKNSVLQREQLLVVLSFLLCSHRITIPQRTNTEGTYCLGVVAKRTIICNSLIKPCLTPSDIGRFSVIDVDTSGVPRDDNGLVRPGIPDRPGHHLAKAIPERPAQQPLKVTGPAEDFTKHIEADWQGNPQTMLLVMRYKGRRIGTINPAKADFLFCSKFVAPVGRSSANILPSGWGVTAEDFMMTRAPAPTQRLLPKVPVVVQAFDKPNMRYAAVGFYLWYVEAIASDDILAIVSSLTDYDMNQKFIVVVVAGYSTK
ncbi:hypothetical protein K491DRAFT_758799 [Lophiostoma macrostomum CBS 122681]|uniref:Uncharacterized protein n=1 Tax=Lophiostoma macrostomum CBS 122681 TaxID=1314788 RepID=A0A6A6T798_9PLEO|nr:hypothetical protein K491DRAFT_758799 [Lophiostoma macrostomum CBS 122681]